MWDRHTRLLPSLTLLLACLAVGIHGGGVGDCNAGGGTCLSIPQFLRVAGDPSCHTVDQIALDSTDLERECGNTNSVCCKLGKVQYSGKRQCDKETPKKCSKRHGGKCQDDCDTIKIDDLCKGSSCTCCVQKAKKCEPKEEYADKEGFCVSKPKHCKKSGGMYKNKGCECKKEGDKAHLCWIEKEKEFHWGYEGESASEFWPDHYPLCGLDRQSPIDIISADAEPLTGIEPFEFTLYDRTPVSIDVKNNGHSAVVYWNDAAKPFVSKGGLDSEYILAQFHFHWGSVSTQGSEHLVDSTAYPIEMHLVHYKSDYGSLGNAVQFSDGLAVLGVMFEVGDENAALKPIVDQLANIVDSDEEVNIQYDMDLTGFLPANTDSFYRYLGSLTTPSCNEVVVWTVFKEPLQISEAQLEEFRKLIDDYDHEIVDNFRPPQALNDRTVFEYSG